MSKEQIIDEAYQNYLKNGQQQADRNKENQTFLPLPKNWFINKCKTDSKFSEKWGLKIEERELSLDERNEIRDMQYFKNNLHQALKGSDTKIDWENTPTKLITITYNNETIESYE